MKLVITFLCLLCIASSSIGQSKLWSLKECLDYAEKNNLNLKKAELTYKVNGVNHVQAQSARIPTLAAFAAQGFNFGRSIDPTTNQFVQQAIRSNNFNLNASMVLFSGMQIHHAIQQQKILEASGDYGYRRAVNDLHIAVITYYLQILMNNAQLEAAKNQLEITTQQVTRAERQLQAGIISEAQIAQLVAKQAGDEIDAATIGNQLILAKVQLSQYLQLPSIDYDIEELMFSSGESMEDTSSTEIISKPTIENMPQVKEAMLRTRSFHVALKAVKGNRYPLLSMNANAASYFSSQSKELILPNYVLREISFQEQVKRNLGQYLGLQLSIPIVNNGISKGNIQRAKINYEIAHANEMMMKDQMWAEITTAQSNLDAASAKYEASQRQRNAINISYTAADKKFIAGVTNIYDFIIEKNNMLQSELLVIQSKYEYMLRQKIVAFYENGSVE